MFNDEFIKSFDNRAFARIKSLHLTPGGREVLFDLNAQESDGTQKLFLLALPILLALALEKPLVFDELDARLHPMLTIELLKLFQSQLAYRGGAQIIFTTHDTHLLSQKVGLLRRDQVWFTEKRKDHSTDLYCLSEFAPRNDEALDRNYLRGKYGAVPYISDLADMMSSDDGKTKAD
jgi:AAA15 family ATPase/GTPase